MTDRGTDAARWVSPVVSRGEAINAPLPVRGDVAFDLKAMLASVRGKGEKLFFSEGITAPNGDQFPFCEWLRGVKAIPPFFWMLAQNQFGG